MRTLSSFVQHRSRLHAPFKNPISDRVPNNLDLFPPGYGSSYGQNLAFRLANILIFGVQRFCNYLNLGNQISNIASFEKLSLTINNYYAIKTC